MNYRRSDISVAPMLDWTDRHCRYFHRLIAPDIRLYTEMITTGAILHGDADRHLRFDKAEHPIALQLGGSDPESLAECARIADQDHGYDEINLNCGCPSDRVQNGSFGACLMHTPDIVARCVEAMRAATSKPVTVKCRIGIDESEEFSFLNSFIDDVSKVGCKIFIVHARKAWLQGLSPKENREIPPLRYDIVRQLKEAHPGLTIILNGGIRTIDDMRAHLDVFDGVMIGREAYQNPYFLADVEQEFFGHESPARATIARAMVPYIIEQGEKYGTPVKSITRHMVNLFHGIPGGRHWRQVLSTEAHKDGVNAHELIETALAKIQ